MSQFILKLPALSSWDLLALICVVICLTVFIKRQVGAESGLFK